MEALNQGVAAWRQEVDCSGGVEGCCAIPLHCVIGMTPGVDLLGGSGGGGSGGRARGTALFGRKARERAAAKQAGGGGLEAQWAGLVKKARVELAQLMRG